MDIKNLRTFLQVADSGSFTKAGELLGYSQPTVSFQIKQLETELNVHLFERIGHNVVLTDSGKRMLSHAQDICKKAEQMTQAAGDSEPKGLVRIAMADSLCTPMIFNKFDMLRRELPQVRLKVMTGGTDELFRLLDHNEADIVCTLDRRIYSKSYVTAYEQKINAHFICSPQNERAKNAECIEQLVELPFILTEKGMSYRRMLDEKLAEKSLEITPILEIYSADMICRLTKDGQALSFLPDYVTQNADVCRLDIDGFELDLWKQVIHHRDKWLSPQVKAVLDRLI